MGKGGMPVAVGDASPRIVPTESDVFNTLLPVPPPAAEDAAPPDAPHWLQKPAGERRFSTVGMDAKKLLATGVPEPEVAATLAGLGADGRKVSGRAATQPSSALTRVASAFGLQLESVLPCPQRTSRGRPSPPYHRFATRVEVSENERSNARR